MTFLMPMSRYFHKCPVEWQAFVRHFNPGWDDEEAVERALLSEHDAIFTPDESAIVFPTEAEYLIFKLRWA